MTIYTVVAYKPNSDCYCRGCHMESYSSDMQAESFLNEKDVIQFVADRLVNNAFMENQEDGYEFTFFADGEQVFSLPYYTERSKAYVDGRILEIKEDLKKRAEAKLAERINTENLQERAEYDRLKRKFEES